MKFTGKEILENEELMEFLLSSNLRVLEIRWYDGSITSGYRKEIYVENVNDKLSLVEGLWSEPIRNNIELTFEFPNLDLYKVFTLSEAAAIWGKKNKVMPSLLEAGIISIRRMERKIY
jgi:hypothetical protein